MRALRVLPFLFVLTLAACGNEAPPPPPAPPTTEAPAQAAFGLEKSAVESYEGRPAIVLRFSQRLAQGQKFDELLAVSPIEGEASSGSWVLDDDGTTLRFPYLEANRRFKLIVKPELASAGGAALGKAVEREFDSGPLEPLLGFASQGSVLPAHESRGLPIVTVNVGEVDVDFLRVRDGDVPKFLKEYQRNGRKSYWSVDELVKFAEPVYANRFALDFEPNQRTLTWLPVRDVAELREPGLYFAVMKRTDSYRSEFDTAMFFVSDIGLHVRAYADGLLVHAASLKSGEPLSGVALTLRDGDGNVLLRGETAGEGLAELAGKPQPAQVLVAEFGRDVTFLAFRQPALDLSEFAVAGRPWRAAEVFPWSGRDLYRPGETVRVAALLRDADGKSMPPQPLFATLRQPDGRTVLQQQLAPGELNQFEFTRTIPADAPTGKWSVDFSTDPAASDAAHAFAFRVEEFLPERLKLTLDSAQATLAPGDPLELAVEAAYLYGAPAAGNRFTARLSVAHDPHPVVALADFHFGDALIDLPKAPADVADTKLDEAGRVTLPVEILKDTTLTGPVAAVVAGSVYETGGRAVNRTLKRTVWPADALVGVHPLFDLADGAFPNADATFEVVRSNVAGDLLAAEGLKLKLVREYRDWHWTWEDSQGWRSDYTARFETMDERTLSIGAGERAQVSLPVEWGEYRLEIADPATGLTLRLPFRAGWSHDDDNRGEGARPDKVKLALDKPAYRGGDSIKVTLTPPHPGPALLVLEGDRPLWHRTVAAQAGTEIEIPLDAAWERHDLYLTALVFRPGSSAERITPKRALGVVHVPIARDDRRVEAEIAAPETMRPLQPIEITVKAAALAGRNARVRVSAVDLGVLNITQFPLPDAARWFFAQRRLGVDAYDVYGRVIEALDGSKARLRYGGDAALLALPGAKRPDPEVRTVDLFHDPVALDAKGEATVSIPVPDFNGTLRVRALVYGDETYAAAERDTIVRAPVVVEASSPRAMAPGDSAQLTLDVQNLSGAPADVKIALAVEGPVALGRESGRLELADGAKRTLTVPLRARDGFGAATITAAINGGGMQLQRRFRLVVRPAWPAERRALAGVLESAAPVAPDPSLTAGLYPASIVAQLSVGVLPPLPFAGSAQSLLEYPYGCIEQTTSRLWPVVVLDPETAERLGAPTLDPAARAAQADAGFARLAAMQTDNGHFGMWPGDDYANTQMTPYVADLLLDARDAGFAIPQAVLDRALERISGDLLSGGNSHYEYDHYDHIRLAEMAYGGYVLARVNRAPVGTLRALHDNERGALLTGLPRVHLGLALGLMGDRPRAEAAIAEAFGKTWERPAWLGDYGSDLRDTALMVALVHRHAYSKPGYDAAAIDLARTLFGRTGDSATRWLSTQEHGAILRLGRALVADAPRSFGASIQVGTSREELTGRALVARRFDPAQLAAGVRIVPAGAGPLYVSQEVAGIPRVAPRFERKDIRIERAWFRTDGTPFEGATLKEGEMLVARLKVEALEDMADALVTDLVPGGLEVENLNLTDASQWDEVTIDGTALAERGSSADVRYEEYRDDRYAAAVKLYGGSPALLFYLVRAVSPGDFVVPPALVEDMYRPELRASGAATPARITVTPP
jgi:uncharacterized protein YfaS (alpha-2-macroglobulin family)